MPPRKLAGYGVWMKPDGRTEESDFQQCCHCGGQFAVHAGSGIERGFCMHCMRPTCGARRCQPCLPLEKFLEREKARIEAEVTRRQLYEHIKRF